MILLFWQTGSFEYDEIFAAVEEGAVSGTMITLTAILIFIGAVGKSGQFPLHTCFQTRWKVRRQFLR
ncbi:NADH-ubiquinone oxidoreductase chain L [Mesobacillus boroniphilus JCM 21738]|uniref:NADH-ubiquinone oxidoreductase chain L n=1 Tax=Mesobacillus boroniphilus JCM 21738 TaxID=1294265 RepID=W4RSZ9_9BACI|nr:NADH-ubiquinone oxidoreductase chain L [Mesobacillus boroniphilus JCM 21738]